MSRHHRGALRQGSRVAAWSDLLRSPMLLVAMAVAACFTAAPSIASAQDAPPSLRRAVPGAGHAVLQALVGTWRVEQSIYIGLGTREHPAVSRDIICRREWVAGGRFLQDVTEGTVAGGPYWRKGLLGYSNMDQRYEWVTVDGFNTMLMIYLGARGSGPQAPITVSGVFTDQGWLGEANVGKPVAMRTVIRFEGNDRHVFELYFTLPGGEEVLVDRKVYTRMAS
jgi:uncharacterized protein DUF1579